MLDWLMKNMEWLFGGIGVTGLTGLLAWLRRRKEPGEIAGQLPEPLEPQKAIDPKKHIHILFVDDDTTFRVVKILKKAGWTHTKITKDVSDIDSADVCDSHIMFIDIQGVGAALGFADEGLGLALAVKKKHPRKKIVIYSAQTTGDRFHRALQETDACLPKNAEPYEFIQLVETLAKTVT